MPIPESGALRKCGWGMNARGTTSNYMVAGRPEAGEENTSNGNYRYSIGFMDIFPEPEKSKRWEC